VIRITTPEDPSPISDAIVLRADPAEAERAATWLSHRLAAAECGAERAEALSGRLRGVWAEIVEAIYSRHAAEQMMLLAVRGRGATLAVELISERNGPVPASVAAVAAGLGLGFDRPEIDGVLRLRLSA